MAVDWKRNANSALWNIYMTAHHYMDMDYIANCLLETIEPDDVLTEEVIAQLRNDPDYLEKVAKVYNDIVMTKITHEVKINALYSAVKYQALVYGILPTIMTKKEEE